MKSVRTSGGHQAWSPSSGRDMHSRLSKTLSRSLLKITKEGDSTSSHWLCLQPQLLALLLPKPWIREKVAQVFSLLSEFNCPTGGEMSTRAKLRETAGQARKDKWASPIHSSKLLDQFTLVKCHLMRVRQKKKLYKRVISLLKCLACSAPLNLFSVQ